MIEEVVMNIKFEKRGGGGEISEVYKLIKKAFKLNFQ